MSRPNHQTLTPPTPILPPAAPPPPNFRRRSLGQDNIEMDPKFTTEFYNHLKKQNEVLMESYRTMFHELHKLQVEEEMLMRKLYELMSAEGVLNKEKGDVQKDRIQPSNAD